MNVTRKEIFFGGRAKNDKQNVEKEQCKQWKNWITPNLIYIISRLKKLAFFAIVYCFLTY